MKISFLLHDNMLNKPDQDNLLDAVTLNSNGTSDDKHSIMFNDRSLEASLAYLQNGTEQNLRRLVSESGNKLAYGHHLWSSPTPERNIEKFWSTQLSSITWSPKFERNINFIRTFLLNQEKAKWLSEVLKYLPRRHLFNTTVYLNIGYDNIVFDENVALNLNFRQFSLDQRESVYYLIHELAHAGYVRYHPLPELWNIGTNRELLDIVKFLTHLEGMGVISAFRLRVSENGLLDNDYRILLNKTEKAKRVDRYFEIVAKLESNLTELDEPPYRVFEEMSARDARLWYIAGCHMAQEIERCYGIETLRNLVEKGSEEFFKIYMESTHGHGSHMKP